MREDKVPAEPCLCGCEHLPDFDSHRALPVNNCPQSPIHEGEGHYQKPDNQTRQPSKGEKTSMITRAGDTLGNSTATRQPLWLSSFKCPQGPVYAGVSILNGTRQPFRGTYEGERVMGKLLKTQDSLPLIQLTPLISNEMAVEFSEVSA